MSTMTTIFAPITKTETQPDGSRLVYGKITGPDLDLDEQRCDPDWLRSAVPDWAQIGNVREMHQAWAVGKALDVEADGDDWYTTAKIVDSEAVKKLDEGIYTGFSIGIKAPRIVKDASAPNGRIVGGKIVETSLVDRPCNESAKLLLVKMAGGHLVDVTKDANAVDPGADPSEDTGEETAEIDRVVQLRQTLVAMVADEAAELAAGEGGKGPISILLGMLDDLEWFVSCDTYDDMAALTMAAAKLAGPQEDTMKLSMVADLVKAARADDASDEDRDAVAELRKALGIDELVEKTTALSEAKTITPEDLAKVEERIVKVEEMAAPGGPSRMPPANDESAMTAIRSEVARFKHLASTVTDRELATVYARKAAALEAAAATI